MNCLGLLLISPPGMNSLRLLPYQSAMYELCIWLLPYQSAWYELFTPAPLSVRQVWIVYMTAPLSVCFSSKLK